MLVRGPCACLCVTMCMCIWVWVCRSEGTMWEDCANRIIRTSTIEKAILLVTDPEKMTQEELARQVVKASTLHPKPKGGAGWPGWQTCSVPRALVTCSRCRWRRLPPEGVVLTLGWHSGTLEPRRSGWHWMRGLNGTGSEPSICGPMASWPHAIDHERLSSVGPCLKTGVHLLHALVARTKCVTVRRVAPTLCLPLGSAHPMLATARH